MTIHRTVRFTAAIALAALVLAGCVEREDRIRIGSDGRVTMTITWKADAENELSVGRVPAAGAGWAMERFLEPGEDGEDPKHVLTATREFDPGDALPGTFDAESDVQLTFPTEVTVEDRDDGRFIHFHRVYPARPYAHIEGPTEAIKSAYGILIEDMGDLDIDSMSRTELENVIRMMIQVELYKKSTFARDAFLDVAPDAPQDVWLRLRDRLLSTRTLVDYRQLAQLIVDVERTGDTTRLDETVNAFEEEAMAAIRLALVEDASFGQGQVVEFMNRYDRHRQYFEVTEGLAAESYVISVEMPGMVVGHNATEVRGNTLTWRFDGKAFRDRAVELMATCRVP